MNSVSLGDDIIDSRDVDSRINELRTQFDGTPFADDTFDSDDLQRILDETPEEWQNAVACLDNDEIAELINLLAFREAGSQYTTEWKSGAVLILDTHFTKYAQQLAEDIGSIERDSQWPASHIDWDAAADELKQDYSEIEVDGHIYWVRNT